MNEEVLDILHEYSSLKERQTNFHDIQEISQQLVLSSLTEVDIDQSSDSTSYISLPEIDDDLHHSYHSLCDEERGWECQSNPSSYYSTSKFLLQEEASPSQSENSFSQLQSIESYNACVIDYTEDDNSGKSRSCSPSTCSFSENASKEKSDFDLCMLIRFKFHLNIYMTI